MICGVLFDLDGTLFDRASSVTACVTAQHARHERMLGAVATCDYVDRFVELDARGYARKEEVYGEIAAELALPESAARELFDDFYEHYHQHAVPFPDLHPTLSALRDSGTRLGIVTNGGEAHQQATIDALGIRHYFAAILISESEGVRKPDPVIFHRALERLNLPPEEAIFVGDHPVVDIQGARDVGLRGIWKRDEYWGECPAAEALIEDLPSLLQVIRSLDATPSEGRT